MKRSHYFYIAISLIAILSFACSESNSTNNAGVQNETINIEEAPTLSYSFSFVGCNRVKGSDFCKGVSEKSTANVYALQRIFKEVAEIEPDLFFFLGDMVKGMANTACLDSQLVHLDKIYKDTSQNPLLKGKTKLIPLPGNHEMLFKKKHQHQNCGKSEAANENKKSSDDDTEYLLKGASDVWLKHMEPYLPTDRVKCDDYDDKDNRMTYSFIRKNIGFIVMNTDSYHKSDDIEKIGTVPTTFINAQIDSMRKNKDVEHIFVLGHKPYYFYDPKDGSKIDKLESLEGVWNHMQDQKVIAMLSAHVHDNYIIQPEKKGSYQVIAGNAGTGGEDKNSTTPANFGFTTINIYSDNTVELISRGWAVSYPYGQDFKVDTDTLQTDTLVWRD